MRKFTKKIRKVIYNKGIKKVKKEIPYTVHYILASSIGILTRNQIESCRVAIVRELRKKYCRIRNNLGKLIKLKEKKIIKDISKKTFNRIERKNRGTVQVKVKFYLPITKKGTKARMGKGKGAIKEYCHFTKIYDPLFVLTNVSKIFAKQLLEKISYKLPVSIILKSYDEKK